MDNVTLFKRIEGRNLVISSEANMFCVSEVASNVHISIDGEIMWGDCSMGINWEHDPVITEIEPDTFEIVDGAEVVIITIT